MRPLTEFTKDKHKSDGLRSSCRICSTEYNKQLHANFLQKRLENLQIPTEPDEVWKQTSYENYYISSKGRMFSVPRRGGGGLLKHKTNKSGYDIYTITIRSRSKNVLLHLVLAEAFIPNPENLPIVDHIDRNTKNNDLSNLRWVSHSTNCLNKNIRGNIQINKRKYNNKQYNYFRLKVGSKQIGNFKTLQDAENRLAEIKLMLETYENFNKQKEK